MHIIISHIYFISLDFILLKFLYIINIEYLYMTFRQFFSTLSVNFAAFNKLRHMIQAKARWIQLMMIIGCTTMWMTSCKKETSDAQMKASYATMKVSTANRELTMPYSASIRGRQDIDIYPQVSGTIERLLRNRRTGCTKRTVTFCNRPSTL